ncbi:MAG: aminoglycoside nucleotidyltransferase, partial [Eubacterium sp.]|nr:aminoglycoside nucleotidyltransferase [Eubacterium sp.]
MMNQQDVVGLLKKAAENNIEIWLDGGWGVDALVGRQTRPHDDLDVFVQRSDSGQFIELLTKDGFIETEVAFTTEGHKAFFHTDGRAVDLHLFEFSKEGALLFEGNAYPSEV